MREILFRGKSLYDNKWVEGFYVHANKAYGEDIDRHFIIEHGEFEYDNYDAWEVYPETVGQYTGLCDKNGKIFEGDIFEWGYAGVKEFRYAIVYDAELASFVGERHFGFVSLNGVDIEVIGNVYDNPELLEVDNG